MKINRLAALAVIACFACVPMFAAEEGSFDRTLKVGSAVDLDVTTGSGSITVNRGSAGQVVVHATIRANNNWFSGDSTGRIREIEQNPPVEQTGNVVRIGHFSDSDRQRNISIDYDIQVPADAKLHARSGSGHVRVSQVNGPVDASTGSGSIEVGDISSEARIQTGSGNITITNVGSQVRAHTGSGSIRGEKIGTGATTASGAYLDFETGSGGIHLQRVAGELKARTGSGSIEVDGQPVGDWDVSTGSGGIRVHLPENSKFNLMARTSSGTVNSDFPITIQGTLNRHELSGPVNGGGPRLQLHTGSGSIHIEK